MKRLTTLGLALTALAALATDALAAAAAAAPGGASGEVLKWRIISSSFALAIAATACIVFLTVIHGEVFSGGGGGGAPPPPPPPAGGYPHGWQAESGAPGSLG